MIPITTYRATHNLGRASICTADADVICDRVNATVMGSGRGDDRDYVQRLLDELCDKQTQQLLQITIDGDTFEEEEEE